NAQEDYTVFAADGALGATFWSFNQNPKNKDSPFYEWFTKKEFRQAMSCLVNRDRLIAQTFRGLAEPKLTLFAEANPFYNPEITLQYRYDVARAEELLASIGMKRDDKGVMRDDKGRAVEFDLTISADTAQLNDAASILADDLFRVGIRLRIRATDFQKVVEQLTASWDWQSVIIGLGSNYWPTQGVNVWPSTGNLHLWYPLQESPATEWEARIDYLYNEGSYTLDEQKSWEIWNEYQAIILEQCPLIYLVRPRSFMAVRNRWDFTNVYFDNIGDLQIDHAFLRQ
ncbi:MAG TPA: ABC transporter substrate-binding protein, partial [Treponemataceae bacterium]|nr:ABC transporter substrate-binding protein [Treponemataceae bacterium]